MNSPIFTNSPEVKRIALAAFPSYAGKKFSVELFSPRRLDSYWDGGSRNYFVLVGLATLKAMEIPQNGTIFDAQTLKLSQLPEGVALVENSIFCGKDLGIRIYLNAENLTPLLPVPTDLSLPEKVALVVTRSYISSARAEYARQLISQTEFEAARASLRSKGFLDKRNAITNEGRNAIGSLSFYSLKAP